MKNKAFLVGLLSAVIGAFFSALTAVICFSDISDTDKILIAVLMLVVVILCVYFVSKAIVKGNSAAITKSDNGIAEEDFLNTIRSLTDKIDTQDKEIKHQLARVEKEKNRLSTIINNMDEGLIILDNDLKVIMLNDSAYSWLGSDTPKEECAGKPIGDVCVSEEICSCIRDAQSVNLTIDGRHLQLHVNHVVSNAEQVGRIGLLLDVSERYAIDRIKQEFTANVSHELKTPLTSILGYAELIESGMAQGDDTLLFAGRIRRESVRMLALISDIIKLSRLDENSDGCNLEAVDLYAVALECKDVLDMNAEKQGIRIFVDGEPCPIEAFSGEITELVYNLIDNGIRYNSEGGEVRVHVVPNSSEEAIGEKIIVQLTVSDTGIGISEEHLPRVFERFYRVDKSRSKETGGTGLGLAIVKHVAERHNAKIDVKSNIGEGTTVTVTFFENKEGGFC